MWYRVIPRLGGALKNDVGYSMEGARLAIAVCAQVNKSALSGLGPVQTHHLFHFLFFMLMALRRRSSK